MKKVLSAFVTTLLVIGFVWGVWRVLGGGAEITDPQWPANAYETIREWFGGADDTIRKRTDQSLVLDMNGKEGH